MGLIAVGSVKRIARAVRLLARDGGLPRWLRGLAAIGLAPIPGPFDEVVLLVVAAILWVGYRAPRGATRLRTLRPRNSPRRLPWYDRDQRTVERGWTAKTHLLSRLRFPRDSSWRFDR
jgi:hypothetical protein